MIFGLTLSAIMSSVTYSIVGLCLLLVSVGVVNSLFSLDLRKEILREHNVAAGIVIAGIFVAMAIIVGAAIFG